MRVWILGAEDPEMQEIENLLVRCGETFYPAMKDGKRCHPGNAYQADTPEIASEITDVVLVECDIRPGVAWPRPLCLTRCDHHRSGDVGFGLAAMKFSAASSLGQVLAYLAEQGLGDHLPFPEVDAVLSTHPLPVGAWAWASSRRGSVSDYGPGWVIRRPDTGQWLAVSDEVCLCAAADHCLSAAYQGQCPGVRPDALMKWRAESRAAFQKRPVVEVLADVESARKILRDATICEACAGSGGYCGSHDARCNWRDGVYIGLPYADLRERGMILELPEAACREGIPFLAKVQEKDGRSKVVLQAAPANLVKQFLSGELVPDLIGMYGDPVRGFAGGYVQTEREKP